MFCWRIVENHCNAAPNGQSALCSRQSENMFGVPIQKMKVFCWKSNSLDFFLLFFNCEHARVALRKAEQNGHAAFQSENVYSVGCKTRKNLFFHYEVTFLMPLVILEINLNTMFNFFDTLWWSNESYVYKFSLLL